MRNGKSADLEYMLQKEVGVMQDTLQRSGYKVVVATLDGSSFSAGSTTVKADIKLADAKVSEYAGFILPCLAVASYPEPEVSPEAIALAQAAIASGKPCLATQRRPPAGCPPPQRARERRVPRTPTGGVHAGSLLVRGPGGPRDSRSGDRRYIVRCVLCRKSAFAY